VPISTTLLDSLTLFARFYQFRQPRCSGFGSFDGGDAVQHLLFIARRAGFKVGPSGFFTFEGDAFLSRQIGALGLFERVNPRFGFCTVGEGFFASGRHAPLLLQVLDFVDVYRAPDGSGFARGEADGVGRLVNALAHAVYPAVAQRLVNGF
jgi:hypothetical protein